ncbi:MAG: glycosyltransferase [Peptococcaceae bacterium]|jgi:glycosyltransferase involved in cell wall biosynthesis|nr:MAG: glycosyltransferase [Peptococcaceae bacterium]
MPAVLLALMGLDIGGAETHVVVLARHLKEMGYKVVVASNGGRYEEEIVRYGVRHYKVPLHRPNLLCIWRSVWLVRQIVAREKIDLIHAHARIPAFVADVMGRPACVRFITTAHGKFTARGILKYVSRWGEKTIAVSQDIKDYLIESFRVKEENIVVIPNGIDVEDFNPHLPVEGVAAELGGGEGRAVIALVSRLDSELARVATNLIEACRQVQKDFADLRLVIVGDGDGMEEVAERAKELNAAAGDELVRLVGARTDINRIMAASDLVVGVSRVALEAMACARNVLLAGSQGFGGLITRDRLGLFRDDNFTGRRFKEKATVENLTRSLRDFLILPKDRMEEEGRRLRAFIVDEYSSLRMAQETVTVYQQVLAKEKG